MNTKKNREQTVEWLKAALTRQQNWQQEVKKRWAEKKQTAMVCAYETV